MVRDVSVSAVSSQMNRGEQRNFSGSLLHCIPDAPPENAIFLETERKNRNKPHDRVYIVLNLSHSIPPRISVSRLACIITTRNYVDAFDCSFKLREKSLMLVLRCQIC